MRDPNLPLVCGAAELDHLLGLDSLHTSTSPSSLENIREQTLSIELPHRPQVGIRKEWRQELVDHYGSCGHPHFFDPFEQLQRFGHCELFCE